MSTINSPVPVIQVSSPFKPVSLKTADRGVLQFSGLIFSNILSFLPLRDQNVLSETSPLADASRWNGCILKEMPKTYSSYRKTVGTERPCKKHWESLKKTETMALPIVIIFERHWDKLPKLVVRDLLPSLAKRGYDTLCFETPQHLTSDEIIKRLKSTLKTDGDLQQTAEKFLKQANITRKLSDVSFSELADLMESYVSSKDYLRLAEKIKQLPAFYILKDVFDTAVKLSISVKGIDIENLNTLTALDLSTRIVGLETHEQYRVHTMFSNLLKIRAQQEEGIVFVCGATHAPGLLAKFKEQNMQDQVLYYFPHSSQRYEDSRDDMQEYTIPGHMHLLREQDVRSFNHKIIQTIAEKTKYKKEIAGGNSHTQFLSEHFKTHFRAFLRPGHRVDALLDLHDASDIEKIRKRVTAVGVQTYDISLKNRKYFVIPNVNTREIADKIRTISPL